LVVVRRAVKPILRRGRRGG